MPQLSQKLPWDMANPLWAQILNPLVANPILSGNSILAQRLVDGVTTINHGLGRMMQGWFVTDIQGAATIYRSEPFNPSTLILTSNAAVTVNLWVY